MSENVDFASLIVKADTKSLEELSQALNGLPAKAKPAENSIYGLTKTISNFAKAAGVVYVIKKASQAIGGLVTASKEYADLAKIGINASSKLQAVIKSTGGAAGFTADELEKMASDLQSVTTWGDEATVKMQAVLLGFQNIKGDNFRRATEAIQDMSAVMETDLVSSAQSLGKALDSPTQGMSSLSRQGFVWTEQEKEQVKKLEQSGKLFEAQAIILKSVESAFGGVSRAMALTDAGKLEQQNNVLGDQKELLGKAILPLMVEWQTAWTSLVTHITPKLLPIIEILTGVVRDKLAPALKNIAESETLNNFLDFAPGAFEDISIMVGNLITNLGKLPPLEGWEKLIKLLSDYAKISASQAKYSEITAETEKLLRVMNEEKELKKLITELTDEQTKGIQNQSAYTIAQLALEKSFLTYDGKKITTLQGLIDRYDELIKKKKEIINESKKEKQEVITGAPIGGTGDTESLKEWNKLVQDGTKYTEQARNPLEELAHLHKELGGLLNKGIISWETMNRLMTKAEKDYKKNVQSEIDTLTSGLLTEEQQIKESYERRRQAILDATVLTGEQKISYIETLNKKEKEQLINQQRENIDRISSGLLTEEEIRNRDYERRKADIIKSTSIEEDVRKELLNRLEEQQQDPFGKNKVWENYAENLEKNMITTDTIMSDTLDNMTSGFGNFFSNVIMNSENMGEAFENVGKNILSSFIGTLGKMLMQQIAYVIAKKGVEKGAQAAAIPIYTGNAEASSLLAGINAYASAAAIPFTGWLAAPGAMAAALAVTQPMVAGVTTAATAALLDKGGTIPPNAIGIVAERGDEIVNGMLVKGPARVTSREQTANMLAGGSKVTELHTHVHIEGNFIGNNAAMRDLSREVWKHQEKELTRIGAIA
jgi:hypothetical protein